MPMSINHTLPKRILKSYSKITRSFFLTDGIRFRFESNCGCKISYLFLLSCAFHAELKIEREHGHLMKMFFGFDWWVHSEAVRAYRWPLGSAPNNENLAHFKELFIGFYYSNHPRGLSAYRPECNY